MSEARRQTRIVYEVFMEIVSEGNPGVRQGDIIERLRSRNHALGIWKVTGEFSTLEELNLIQLNIHTGLWSPVPDRNFELALVDYNGDWKELPTGE